MSLLTCSTSIGSASKRVCDNYMKHKRKYDYRTPPRTKLDSLLENWVPQYLLLGLHPHLYGLVQFLLYSDHLYWDQHPVGNCKVWE